MPHLPVSASELVRTRLRNTSGSTKTFSFIPPHGRRLDDDAEVSIVGDIYAQFTSERARNAFVDAIATGELTIVHTPAAIVEDDVDGEAKQLVVASGVVTGETPELPSSV